MRTIARGLELFYVELATDLKSVLFGVNAIRGLLN